MDEKGNLVGISPTCGRTKGGVEQFGKEFECPVFSPLALDKRTGETVEAAAGGGRSVAELATGDVMEIFQSRVLLPKSSPPRIEVLQPPAEGEQTEESPTAPDENSDGEEDVEEISDTGKKNQFYRRTNWLNLHQELFRDAATPGPIRATLVAWKTFVESNPTLEPLLEYFHLPNPQREADGVTDPEKKQKKVTELTQARMKALKQIGGARFAFRINGKLMLKDAAVVNWWRDRYAANRQAVMTKLPEGTDMFTPGSSGRLTTVFPHIAGVPGGGSWCPLASFDKATTQSYGLGKVTTQMTLENAERAAAALNYLLRGDTTSLRISKSVKAVFWAVDTAKEQGLEDTMFTWLMSQPDPLQVLNFLKNVRGHAAAPPDSAKFYCALISSPKARITIRSWHTDTLRRVVASASSYFESVSLPTGETGELETVTMEKLAKATVMESKKTPPSSATFTALLDAALFGCPLPHRILQQTVRRQSLELAGSTSDKAKKNFEPRLRGRTALIKLYFAINIKGDPMPENHPAYLCGRLLAILDKIHNEAHENKTASSPASRYYGAASTTPALAFPQLCKLVRHHLNKMSPYDRERFEFGVPGDRRADDCRDDFDGLAAVAARLNQAAGGHFPRLLPLEDQGRFAIGFYYERERCKNWPHFKKRTETTTT
ncbi:MAG: type I-C CRISPR-associated protein Cas8c/Csd1 [Verrucomicrobiia bacterium]